MAVIASAIVGILLVPRVVGQGPNKPLLLHVPGSHVYWWSIILFPVALLVLVVSHDNVYDDDDDDDETSDNVSGTQ